MKHTDNPDNPGEKLQNKEDQKKSHRISASKLAVTALFMALTCVATMVLKVATDQGYANLGDAFVLLGAFLLGPVYGAIAGGIGSAMADLLLSYAHYVPGTLIIKGVMVLIATGVFYGLKKISRHEVVGWAISTVIGVVMMELARWIFLSKQNGLTGPTPHIMMDGVVVLAVALTWLLTKVAKRDIGCRIAAGVAAEGFMVFGYWFYKSLILGKAASALTSIPTNLIQGILGVAVGVFLYELLSKIPQIRKAIEHDGY